MKKITFWEAIKKAGWYWLFRKGFRPEKYMSEVSHGSMFINGEQVHPDELQDADFHGPVIEPDWN